MKYGLIISKPEPQDYILSGYSKLPQEILCSDGDWTAYLPKKEFQNLYNIEPFACVVFTTLNCIEILIKRKYGEVRNYSDRFLATAVNTRGQGTTPQKCAEFLRKIGVCTQDEHPFNVKTEDEFFAPLSNELKELAKEFNKEWDFKHEYVDGKDIDRALQYSPLLISVFAWYRKGDIYIRPKGKRDNHATTYIKREEDSRLVFDSYGPGLKKIDLKALPMVAKRFHVEKKTSPLPYRKSFISWLRGLMRYIHWGREHPNHIYN